MYVQMNQNIFLKTKNKKMGAELGSIHQCWLDSGRSECKLAVDQKKDEEFKQTKWLESPTYVIRQKSVIFTGRLNQDMIKKVQKKEANVNELFIINNLHLENRQGWILTSCQLSDVIKATDSDSYMIRWFSPKMCEHCDSIKLCCLFEQ